MLYFHPDPQSSAWAPIEIEEECAKHRVHILSVDRPGVALSTPMLTRSIVDYADGFMVSFTCAS